MSHSTHHVLWAINAQANNHILDSLAYDAICSLTGMNRTGTDRSTSIEVVTLVPLDTPHTAHMIHEARADARRTLSHKLSRMGLDHCPAIQRLTVFVEPFSSINEAAKKLALYAKDTHADFIALGTHARKGLSRLFWGSFTEALICASNVPLLTVSQNAHFTHAEDSKLHHILFPTDFNKNAIRTYLQILKLAQETRARVTIFHTIPVPVGPMELPIPFAPPTHLVIDQKRIRQLNRREYMLGQLDDGTRYTAKSWLRIAKEQYEVDVDLVVEHSHEGVAYSLLHHLEEHPSQLIALDSHDASFPASLLGSITRTIEREAPCPVWISHHAS